MTWLSFRLPFNPGQIIILVLYVWIFPVLLGFGAGFGSSVSFLKYSVSSFIWGTILGTILVFVLKTHKWFLLPIIGVVSVIVYLCVSYYGADVTEVSPKGIWDEGMMSYFLGGSFSYALVKIIRQLIEMRNL